MRAEATEAARELFALVGDMQVFARQLADLKPALRDPLLASLEQRSAEPASESGEGGRRRGGGGGGGGRGRSPALQGPLSSSGVREGGEEAGGFEVGPDQCQFCLRRDAAWVSEEALDLHFWKECPLLTSCEQCGQVGAPPRRPPLWRLDEAPPPHTHTPTHPLLPASLPPAVPGGRGCRP